MWDKINPCHNIKLMCWKYSDLEGFDPRARQPSKNEIISIKRLERLLCRIAKDNCIAYQRRKLVYKMRRSFKGKRK